jgi:hypothetical protein
MVRTLKFLAPVVALGLMVGLSSATRAQEHKGAGTVAGHVMGADGKAAANIKVRILAANPGERGGKKKQLQAEGEKPKKAERQAPVAEGTTGDDGSFSIANVPAGDYVVQAGGKGVGNAREKVSVKAGETANVTLTLKEPKKGEGKAKE